MSNPKNIDGLIDHLNDKHSISSTGVEDKQNLKNIGYFHGYKGYRFIKIDNNPIDLKNIQELVTISEFDNKLKSFFYTHLMFLETAIKNYVLEEVLKVSNSANYEVINNTCLNYYKEFNPHGNKKNKNAFRCAWKSKLGLSSKVYSTINNHIDKDVIKHFCHKNMSVPIWAIFEILTLGSFATFISCLNRDIKENISVSLKLYQPSDTDKELTQFIVAELHKLRNAMAHNEIIYDVRFNKNNVKEEVLNSLKLDIKLSSDLAFNGIQNYFILVIYMLSRLNVKKEKVRKIINDYNDLREQFREDVDLKIYSQIFATTSKKEIEELLLFVDNL